MVSPLRGVKRFGVRGKLSPRFGGHFEVLEQVGEVAYKLAMPPALSGVHNVFHVSMLRKYVSDSTHVMSYESLELDQNLSYEESRFRFLTGETARLRRRHGNLNQTCGSGIPSCSGNFEDEISVRRG